MERVAIPMMSSAPIVLLAILALSSIGDAFLADKCDEPLGMESKKIPDSAITASSSFNEGMLPGYSRANKKMAWCPKGIIKPHKANEYLQIKLSSPTSISGFLIQGRSDDGAVEYTPFVTLQYYRPGIQWTNFRWPNGSDVIKSNVNHTDSIRVDLPYPVIATLVRFVPVVKDSSRYICMRTELYGCVYDEPVVSYSAPQGATHRSTGAELMDYSYDGPKDSQTGRLTGGLGVLFDRRLGPHVLERDSVGWVGWKKSKIGHSVRLQFEFDSIRNFSAVSLHCLSDTRNSISPFKRASISLGLDSDTFVPPVWMFEPDLVSTTGLGKSEWIKIPIHQRTAKFITLELTFDYQYLLLSEIKFDSTPIHDIDIMNVKGQMIANSKKMVSQVIPTVAMELEQDVNTLSSDTGEGLSDRTTGIVFTVDNMPPKYIGLVVGASLGAAVLCAIVVIFILCRQRQNKPGLYSSVYTTTPPLPSNLGKVGGSREMHLVVSQNGTIVTHAGQVSSSPSSHANYFAFDDQEQAMRNLPLSAPPKHIPIGFSPPPEYFSNCSDSSEYAEPDEPAPTKSSSQTPLIPPPPLTSSRRNRGTNNHAVLVGGAGPEYNTVPESSPFTSLVQMDQVHYAASNMSHNPQPTCSKYFSPLNSSISSVGTIKYSCIDTTVFANQTAVYQIPRHRIRFREKLGEGEFGEVHLCELDQKLMLAFPGTKLVAVKLLRRSAAAEARKDFEKEMQVLSKLKDPNIVQLLGICTNEEPFCIVAEYMQHGDLNQVLKCFGDNFSSTKLIGIAAEIASGMKYLESLNFVHRDLATRNCLVGGDHFDVIKIGDFGMARSLYANDYYRIEGKFVLPIRWMAWESILLGKFTPKTDVWSFGVTLWEIFTLCRQQPFVELSDEQVVNNVQHICQTGMLKSYLPEPIGCSSDCYELMLSCWHRDDLQRPSFSTITEILANTKNEMEEANNCIRNISVSPSAMV